VRRKLSSLRAAAACGLVAICSLTVSCGDSDESDEDVGLPDASPTIDSGSPDSGHDPYWSDYDATVDILPDATTTAKYHVWADWTSFSNGVQGSAEATIYPTDAGLGISYLGQLVDAQVQGGTVYWLPDTAYKSVLLKEPPTSADILMLHGGNNSVHELNFSTPVKDPVLALMSVGSKLKTTVCRFDDAFELLSFGGTPWNPEGVLKHLPNNVLSGRESSGVIRFPGTHSRIRFTTVLSEPWFGITVGMPVPQ
jgi:hypothetical protein